MQTRRVFLKTLLGFCAFALPWSHLPSRWEAAWPKILGRPPVKFLESEEISDFTAGEGVNWTAMDDVAALTTYDMQGRNAGSLGEIRAAKYLSSQLSILGLKPMGDKETGFMQVFTIPPVIESIINGRLTFKPGNVSQLRTPSVNILGALEGENTEEIIMLSAHYDHLGVYEGRLYPGANDNASGVGCVLDVMRRILREGVTPKRTIVLAFWSAEEMGFVGSQAFVNSPTFPLSQIQAVLNVDTIGNGEIGDFALWSEGDNPAFVAMHKAASEAGASAPKMSPAGHNSDSISFASARIPAVTLLARDWLKKNHTPEDDINLLKPEQVRLAAEIVYRAVKILAF